MKNRKKILCILTAAALVFALPGTAFAGPALSAEEQAALADNVLNYEEIPALISTYNATVLANNADYQKNVQAGRSAEGTANRMESLAQMYDEMGLAAESTSATQAAAYYMQAETLRTQAADNVTDYHTLEISNDKARLDIEKDTKHQFFEYYRLLKKKAYLGQSADYLARALNSAKTRRSVGAGTEIEELSAQENLQKAQSALVTVDAEISAVYRTLITRCGWKYDAAAEIGPEPAADPASVIPADKEKDREEALKNSLTLAADTVLYENAKRQGGTTEEKYRKQLENDTVTARSGFTTAYDTLMLSKATYDTKATRYAVLAGELATAGKQLSLGAISRMEYAAKENEVNSARFDMESALCDLMIAREDYAMTVAGLL